VGSKSGWAEGSGAANQQWSVTATGNGSYSIVNRFSGLALDDTGWSTSNGTIVQQWSLVNGQANQQWNLLQA
jgi:arabinan endo-1,5-alpha-L-arabinosidase